MRLFFPQSALDRLVEGGEATLDGDLLRYGGATYRLVSGVHFRGAEGGASDSAQLVGRVKDAQQLSKLGVEVIAESALIGEMAYVVTPGFLGVSEAGHSKSSQSRPGEPPVNEEDAKLLSQFLLEKP